MHILFLKKIITKVGVYPHRTILNSAKKFTFIHQQNSDGNKCARSAFSKDFLLYLDFVNETEEQALLEEVGKSFRRTKYEYEHWDGAIHGFRETEKTSWTTENQTVISRIKNQCFEENDDAINAVHVLDLARDGLIRPHIDSVKFCGTAIAGLNLLSAAVARFTHPHDASIIVDALLPRRSLYVMRNAVRFDFNHEILGDSQSYWKDEHVPRQQRISVLLRNEPKLKSS